MFEILLSVVSCHDHELAPDAFWLRLGYECFAGSHLGFVVVALVLATVFAGSVAVYTLVFIDSNPLLPGMHGCSSGRAALFMLLWKVRAPGWHGEGGEARADSALCCSVAARLSLQIVLIILVETVPEYVTPPALCAIVVIAGFFWMGNTLLWVEH